MMPLEFMQSWALYMFDPDNKHMLVMDPTLAFEGADVMRAKHEGNAKKILYGLIRCIHENIPDWELSAAGWQIDYNGGAHAGCTREQSGVYILHCIREYNGVYLRSVLSNERLEYMRKSMAYQLITLKGNAGDLPDFMIQIIY